MRLTEAIRLAPGMSVAFTGAGGKSLALETLARESLGRIPFVATTTTHLASHQSGLAATHLLSPSIDDLARRRWTAESNVLVTGAPDETGKWTAPADDVLETLRRIGREQGAILAIEADGARRRLIKAPAAHEPAVPSWVDMVVPVAGFGVVGRPLGETVAHRPERIAAILEVEIGAPLSGDHLARLMTARDGGLKGVPDRAEVRCLLTSADGDEGDGVARRMLKDRRIQSVALGAEGSGGPVARSIGRVGGVILAAGGGARLGRAKAIVEWKGEPLIRHVLRAARAGGLDPIVVVLGAEGAAVRSAIEGEGVTVVENPAWAAGQSTSVRMGLEAVEREAEAVVFLLADMPRVSPRTIQRLVRRHEEALAYAVAPVAEGRRGNPVLFDRSSFAAFRELTGDQGGRSLLEGRSWEAVEADPAEFFDLDVPDDLSALERMA